MAILANELRIGNWVNLIALDQKIQITSISKVDGLSGLFTWIEKEEEYEDSLTGIDPIPLTPAILEAAGFAASAGWKDTWLWCGSFSINKHAGDWYWNDLSKNVKLNYVHQLQNLYFALTGTELTIKL